MSAESSDGEAPAIIDQSVNLAWTRALAKVPSLALLAGDGGKMREALSRTAREGFSVGITDPTELADYVLRTASSKLLKLA